MDHYDIPDLTEADNVSPQDFESCDPWGNFKWWMFTQKIKQILLDYVYQHGLLVDYLLNHPYDPDVLFAKIGLPPIDFSLAKELMPEVLEEIMEERADKEATDEFLLEEDANKDPMYRLLQTIEGAKEFGCEMDKSFAWEGLDLLSQENVDEHCGHGDPSQWTY